MIERRQDLRFAREPRPALRIGRECGRQYLQRDVAPQLRIPRAVDFAHSAFAQLGHDLKWTDGLPNHGRGLRWATARPRRSSRINADASGGGPPAPSGARISYGPRRVPG